MTNTDVEPWVALLRGMNLGNRRLTNPELQAAVEACGCRDVRLYQASGNAIFVDDRDRAALTVALESGLESRLGYAVPVFLRSAAEVRAIAASSPFSPDEEAASTGKPQVVFLRDELSAGALHEVESLVPSGDRLVSTGRQLHWLPAQGLSANDLDLRTLDAVAGGTTVRTHGTIQRLATKLG